METNDVLLILPPIGSAGLYVENRKRYDLTNYKWILRLTRVPQGILSIATMLENFGFKVAIFDCRLHLRHGMKGLANDLRKAVKQTKTLVGLSCLTFQIPSALEISRLIREVNPSLKIVWGGYHPSLYPEQTVQDSLVDFVIQGEAEMPFTQLIQELIEVSNPDLGQIESLVYMQGKKVLANPLASPFEINRLPTPSYHLLEIKHYLTKRSYNPDEDVTGLEYTGSRGCSYNCSFCINTVLRQKRCWRGKNPDLIIRDLQVLKEKYKIKYVFFEEELLFHNPKRALELVTQIKPLDLRWAGNTRIDTIIRYRDVLVKARDSGWCETSVGCETGSNRLLNVLRKNISVDMTLQACRILKELDVYALYSFMINLPTETDDERNMTYRLMRQLRKIHPKSEFIGPQTYRPYPKTELYTQLLKEGKFKEPQSLSAWVDTGFCNKYA